ncbi:argininosuccinate lyase [Pigmentiphaga soli]|uniref:Argininosuccinate lyase n=1 Tax=Pigmentiphaga soli TaxID=1007095 RepID=A0ABP8GLV2_9BURK
MITRDEDEYHWLSEMNKAANVVLLENRIIDAATARRNADAIVRLDAEMRKPGADRTGNYQQIEPRLIDIGGVEVSTLHCGRSRVDIVATSRRLLLRPQILCAMERLNAARQALLRFGEKHKRALVPAYTQGRQSAGVPVGHYITAYTAALEVEFDNLRQAYDIVNQSPLGAGAVATSSFPLDRHRLSDLLGFSRPIENSLFANELSVISAGARVVSATTSGALIIGALASDIEQQYARTVPWFTVSEGPGLTGTSSSMPHKVNPTIVNDIRQQASVLVGTGMTYTVRSHNVPHGMPDSKRGEPNVAIGQYAKMMDDVARLFGNLNFDESVARQEVETEYSATPELADTLQRMHKVPFRVGHHFASAIVEYGRAHGLPPARFPYAVARTLYANIAGQAGIAPNELPLDEVQFEQAISSTNMVASALGLGGPQPAEVDRMIAAGGDRTASDARWIAHQRARLAEASQLLRDAFQATLETGPV